MNHSNGLYDIVSIDLTVFACPEHSMEGKLRGEETNIDEFVTPKREQSEGWMLRSERKGKEEERKLSNKYHKDTVWVRSPLLGECC